jgi:putative FmdB family regulatory protein
MPMWDYTCEKCGNVVEVLILKRDKNLEVKCDCGNKMKRIFPNKTSFKLVYNNKTDMCSWGYEGYASSQYWRDYKAAKERGENVKPAGAD